MHVSEVFFSDLFLDPDRFHDFSHLNPRIRDLSLLPLFEYPHGFRLFVRLHHLSLVPVPLDRLLQLLSPQLHLTHDLGVGANPPLREGTSQHVLLH